MKHLPITESQKDILAIYKEAKFKGRLHDFTCMRIDPSIKDGKLLYKKGLPPAVGLSREEWNLLLREYNPSRNSQWMPQTEYVCRNLFIIQKLVESGCEVGKAWYIVCDESKEIAHFCYSNEPKGDFEMTGMREVCGFCDLGNTVKILEKDPWDKSNEFVNWTAGGAYRSYSDGLAVSKMYRAEYRGGKYIYQVALISLD